VPLRLLVLAVLAALVLPASVALAADGIATREMTDCAALGAKHPGSDADRAQGDRVAQRFREAGLNTSFEAFHMPVWEAGPVTAKVLGDDPVSIPAESFAYGGVGDVEAEVVDGGGGTGADLAGQDLRGKIVMVNSSLTHRTVQVVTLLAAGAKAMLYVSGSPDNLIQTGAVAWAYKPPVSIPTVTIGADDGAALRARMKGGPLRMALSVRGERVDRVGRNVIGVRPGTKYPDRYIVIGGHYDSWHAGAVDNCTAVGSLIEMAEATKKVAPAYTLIFAGWDAEEPGLVGSSNWIIAHPDLVSRTVLNVNLEMTSVATYISGQRLEASVNLAAGSSSPAMLATLIGASVTNITAPVVVPLTLYRQISGGIIPTDLENFYGRGVQGFSTASSTPFYHTTEDKAGTVIPGDLQRVTGYLSDALNAFQLLPPEVLTLREVPRLELSAPGAVDAGAAVPVDLTLTGTDGRPMPGKRVELLADQRDSWAVATGTATDLGGGRYRWTLPAGTTDADLTRLRARVQDPGFISVAFGTVDQRHGGPLAAGSTCRSRRVVTLRLRAPKGTRIRTVGVTTTKGRAHVSQGRTQIRLDLRGARKGTVTVRVRARLSTGRLLRQTRTFRTCA
jgi:hypothetical protein